MEGDFPPTRQPPIGLVFDYMEDFYSKQTQEIVRSLPQPIVEEMGVREAEIEAYRQGGKSHPIVEHWELDKDVEIRLVLFLKNAIKVNLCTIEESETLYQAWYVYGQNDPSINCEILIASVIGFYDFQIMTWRNAWNPVMNVRFKDQSLFNIRQLIVRYFALHKILLNRHPYTTFTVLVLRQSEVEQIIAVLNTPVTEQHLEAMRLFIQLLHQWPSYADQLAYFTSALRQGDDRALERLYPEALRIAREYYSRNTYLGLGNPMLVLIAFDEASTFIRQVE